MNQINNRNQTLISLGIIGVSLALAFAPIPGVKQVINVVSGTELKEPLKEIEAKFEQDNPSIDLKLKFQGSQDLANYYIDQKKRFPGKYSNSSQWRDFTGIG